MTEFKVTGEKSDRILTFVVPVGNDEDLQRLEFIVHVMKSASSEQRKAYLLYLNKRFAL